MNQFPPPGTNPGFSRQPQQQYEDVSKRTKGSLAKFFASLAIIGLCSFVVLAGLIYWFFSRDLPKLISLADYRPRGVTEVFTREGTRQQLVGEFYREKRYLIPFEQIPQSLTAAFISAEDDRFFEHQGIRPMAILRASIANFRAGQVVQGGSTITQQVAKSLFLTPERSFVRKIKEAILANRIEENLNKEQILYLYLNQIYLGHGAYGVQAAARAYFRKEVAELNLPEAAILAGLPRAPTKYSPFVNAAKAKERQLYVLRRMFENSYITQEQMMEAAATPIKIYRKKDIQREFSRFFTEHIRRYLIEKYGERTVYEDALSVFLPRGMELMVKARDSLQAGLREIDKRRGFRGPIQRLETEEERAEFLRKNEEEIIRKRVPYYVLFPDGRMDLDEAIHEMGFETPESRIVAEEFYQGLVVEVNDRRKHTMVNVGGVLAKLPLDRMEWVYPMTEPGIKPKPPNVPSEVIQEGDVLLVRLSKEVPEEEKQKKRRKRDPKPEAIWFAQLEQAPQVQGALFSIEARSGYVLAMEGGFNFGRSEFNRAIQAQRQPGSAFKPLIFAAAVERGYTPATIIVDSPIVYKDDISGKWKPENFTEKFYGDTTFRSAFIKSRNIPTIKLVQKIQVPNVIDYARRLGMTGKFNEDLSISLGSATTSLLELTRVYSLFPRNGKRVDPIFVSHVVDRDGLVLEENRPDGLPDAATIIAKTESIATNLAEEAGAASATQANLGQATQPLLPVYPLEEFPDQLMDPRVAFVVTQLMTDVVKYGTGWRAQVLKRPTGGKTGTTNDYKDAWFVGFTPQVVTGVWVGFDDQRTIGPGETGARAALPIWIDFMKTAVDLYPIEDFTMPPGISMVTMDAGTGKITDPKSINARTVAFVSGSEPSEKIEVDDEGSVDNQSDFFKEDF